MLSANRYETRKAVAVELKEETESATGCRLSLGSARGPVARGTSIRGTATDRLGSS